METPESSSSNDCALCAGAVGLAHVVVMPCPEQQQTTNTTAPRYVVKKVSHAAALSTTERCVKGVAPPPRERLAHERLYSGPEGALDLSVLAQWLAAEGRLELRDASAIVQQATAVLHAEPTVLAIPAPVTICGDVHGQFYDLLKLFEVGGSVATTRYLFLGDYVDRGTFSVEVVLLLYALKLAHPASVFLVRGNHECRHLTEYFTFRTECVCKYSADLYEDVLASFNALPLAAVVNRQFLCLHGGLSPELETVDDIRAIDRFREPPPPGAMCDLLWADPAPNFVPADPAARFAFNRVRGCSFVFTYHAVAAFLERNNLLSLVRAHEAQDDGYKMLHVRAATGFPSVITVFSAPNYLDTYNNRGAVLHLDGAELNVRQFNRSPHPYWLPNFSNAITWSIPFVAEKIAEMLLALMKSVDDEEEHNRQQAISAASKATVSSSSSSSEGSDGDAPSSSATAPAPSAPAEVTRRRVDLRHKILSVSRFLRMFSVLRNEAETVNRIKYFSPDSALPRGVLLGGKLALQQCLFMSNLNHLVVVVSLTHFSSLSLSLSLCHPTALCDFEAAAKADSPNLRRPPLPPEVEPAAKYIHRRSLDGGPRGDPLWDDEDDSGDEDPRLTDR